MPVNMANDPATRMRPILSLANPIAGRPTAVPKFIKAVMILACDWESPIDTA